MKVCPVGRLDLGLQLIIIFIHSTLYFTTFNLYLSLLNAVLIE